MYGSVDFVHTIYTMFYAAGLRSNYENLWYSLIK